MEEFNDDIIYVLASFLTARELGITASTCKRFGGMRPTPAVMAKNNSKKWKRAKRRKRNPSKCGWNLMEEAARKMVEAMVNDDDNSNVDGDYYDLLKRKGGESWLRVYHRSIQLRTQLAFTRFIGNLISHRNIKDLSCIQRPKVVRDDLPASMNNAFALCQEIMSGGEHYAEFTVTDGRLGLVLGIMRPVIEWDDTALKPGPLHNLVRRRNFGRHPDSCGYIQFCREQNQEGNQGYAGAVHNILFHPMYDTVGYDTYVRGAIGLLRPQNDYTVAIGLLAPQNDYVIGLLLDLDEGTLSVYFNGEYLGIKQRGLQGHYRWAVSFSSSFNCKPIVKISRGPIPHE